MTGTRGKSTVPRLRFKGCEGVWLRQPIGEFFSERDERSAEGVLLSVTIRNGVVRASDSGKADSSSADKSHYKVVKIRDLAYNSMRMWQGACGASRFDGIVSPAYTVIVPNAESDSDFFEYTFKRPEALRQFQRNSQGMTSDTWNLKFPLLKDICILCPEQNTQVQIANTFRNFDKLIFSEASHLAVLRQLKRAMLVKMFPRPGQCVPEIRFKGFEGGWEDIPLADIADKVVEKNVQKDYSEVFTNSAECGIVSQREYFDFDVAKNIGGYYVVRNGDFIYNPRMSKEAPVGPINMNNLARTGVMSPLYFVFRTHGIDEGYLSVYFKTKCWHPFMLFNGDSGARSDRFSIRNEVFMRMPISKPSLPEQRKIAAFFRNLDRLIGAAEKKVAKLKQVKASLLERMFV